MNRRSQGLTATLLLLLLAGCNQPTTDVITSAPSPKRVASETVVTVEAPAVEMNAGASVETNVRLKVDHGYHINANPASFPYLIATELNVPKADGISAARVNYPQPVSRKFSFSEEPLSVYENAADLRVTLLADASARRGQTSIPAKLRIQACDDKVCYPPGTIDVWIPVTVK
ncbi:MAG TPA: protein-disulfide reductase DsbD domain-containing protein [Pyrinomonadaceae bacterium]|nr:protein-disulfide reductase DsbD domain-containing protein [Pyrinomonadaceae bacterium]